MSLRLYILCFSASFLTIPLLRGMDFEVLQKMNFDMLVNVIESKHSSSREIERQDAMAAMTLITCGNANSNPSFISNHQEKKSYKRFTKLCLTSFFIEMEKTSKVAGIIDQKDNDIDVLGRIQNNLAPHNKTIVFTPQQLRSNPHLLNQPNSVNPAALSMSFQKYQTQHAAEKARWMEGTEEMIPTKEKALGKICLFENTQKYYNDLFQQYINEINEYNSGNKEIPQAALLSIAENIEIFKYLPAYEKFKQLDLSKALMALNLSPMYTQKKYRSGWDPRKIAIWPDTITTCQGSEIIVHPLEEISTLREIQGALAPHNESVTYLDGQEPLVFPEKGTKSSGLQLSSRWQAVDRSKIPIDAHNSIKGQCVFIKMFREQEEFLKKNTKMKPENETLLFERAVTIVAQACKSENYTEQACCALLDIAKALRWNGPQDALAIISKNTLKQDNAAYRQFNNLNLSGLITYYSTNFPQMKDEPFMQEKEAPQLFQKVTKWQVFLGSLAQHNHSISMEMSSTMFSRDSDSALRVLAEQALNNAEYFKHVANAKTGNESDIQAITAMLYFGEIALRENSRQTKKHEQDIQSEQPKIIEQAKQQNLQLEDKLPENPINNAPQNGLQEKMTSTIASKTPDNIPNTTIEQTSSLKEQKSEQPQEKQTPPKHQIQTNEKKETLLTPPFYQRPLLMSALVCCSAFLVWYFQEQIPTYLSYFYD